MNWVEQLPGIVQGIIASFLFWGLLKFGEKVWSSFSNWRSKLSASKREYALLQEKARIIAVSSKDHGLSTRSSNWLMYSALHEVVRGLFMLTVGLLVGALNPIFGVVAYIFSLYFFGQAMNAVRDIDTSQDFSERLEEINRELSETKNET